MEKHRYKVNDAKDGSATEGDDHLPLLSSELQRLNISIATLRFGDWIVERSWQVVTPSTGLVALMVTMPKKLL